MACATPTSHPGVLFKTLVVLLVNNYTQLYVHMYTVALTTPKINPNPTNQIRSLKRTLVL